MRTAAIVALITTIVADSHPLLLYTTLPYLLTDFPIAHAIELLATIFLLLYLLQIARRTGSRLLTLQTRIAMPAIILAICAWALLEMVSDQDWSDRFDTPARLLLLPIFIYQLFLFFLFRRTLNNSAAFARQYWHFCSPIPAQTHVPPSN